MSKEWKQKRADVLFNREQSHFLETMKHIEKLNQIDVLKKSKTKITEEIKTIQTILKTTITDKKMEYIQPNILIPTEIMDNIKMIQDEIKNIQDKIEKELISPRKKQIKDIDTTIYKIQNESSYKDTQEPFTIRSCSLESCKGILHKITGTCLICQKQTCLSCNRECLEGHICKEEDLDTWMEICKHSKPCPNCATRISKIDGCSQMWCPHCHKAFNWNTGKIENGVIHNPHYYEYVRQNPHLNIQENECHPNYVYVYGSERYKNLNLETTQNRQFGRIFDYVKDIVLWELPFYRDRQFNNLDIRIKYLKNNVEEDKFKKTLVKREIQYHQSSHITDILETIDIVFKNMLSLLIKKSITFDEFVNQYKDLMLFSNENIRLVNKLFNTKFQLFIVDL
jgi:hypothetical protein